MPAVRPVGVPEPVLDLERLTACLRELPALLHRRNVLGVHDGPRAHLVAAGHAGVLVPALVVEDDLALGVRRPDDLRNSVGEGSVPLLALSLERIDLLLLQQGILPPDLDCFLPKIDEDRDLRPQDVRLERLHQIVHGSGVVAAEDVLCVLGDRSQEDDRDVAGPLARA